MSDQVKQKILVEGQDVYLTTNFVEGGKFVSYEFSSAEPLHPLIVAAAMLRIVDAICVDNKIEMRDLYPMPNAVSNNEVH